MKRFMVFSFCLLSSVLLYSGNKPPCFLEETTRILVIGDSYSKQMFRDGVFEEVFDEMGRYDVRAKGDVTAISGIDAADWATPEYLQIVADELAANPTIDIVHISLGINDLIEGEWNPLLTEEETIALIDGIAADLSVLITFIHDIDPDIKVVYSGYDYMNFEDSSGIWLELCAEWLEYLLGNPTTLELNEMFVTLDERVGEALSELDNTTVVSNLGLMQYTYGFPDEGILPGDLEMPGDPSRPSPATAIRNPYDLGLECIHFNADAYKVLIRNVWNQFYAEALCFSGRDYGQAISECASSGGDVQSLKWMKDFRCDDD